MYWTKKNILRLKRFMRNDFVKQMKIEMVRDKSIFFLTGDLGFNALEPLAEKFPKRFYNVGVAEQNLVGLAAGLALNGHKVVIYSIASFVTMRCYEQTRTDICYHNLDVKIIGTGGGFNYSDNGITHHTIEDLSIMRVLPNMKVFCPSYSWEAIESTKAMMRDKGPAYLRLGKSPGINYNKPSWSFKIGRGYAIKPGRDITLFLTGNISDAAFGAAKIIEKETKKSVEIISLPTVKPLDERFILNKLSKAKGVFTIEEHNIVGGLGTAIATIMAKSKYNIPFKIFGIPDRFIKEVGTREYLCELAGLSPISIAAEIKKVLKKKSKD